MYFYKYQEKTLISLEKYVNLEKITEEQASKDKNIIYFLKGLNPIESRSTFALTHPSLIFLEKESLSLLRLDPQKISYPFPKWLLDKIKKGQVKAINTAYKDWKENLHFSPSSKKWRVNIAGIGDVGSTLLIGLRLLGFDCIEKIGIFDLDQNKLKRFEFEINQITSITTPDLPPVRILQENEIFNCDLFIFSVTARVPAIGEENADVRMVQFQSNSKIIATYGKMARNSNFKGIFAVLSDPVDLLCKSVYLSSNQNKDETFDFMGLRPEQIRGYGLGVMNARALYYANQSESTKHFAKEGRVFGPHGADLIVANSIENYNKDLSLNLTEKTKTANLELRKIGFKPYIAPALSSGALSIIATIKGQWNYSATFIGGVYMGAKNRLTPAGTELEILNLPDPLYKRLEKTYDRLRELL